MTTCCKDCSARELGCHGTCERNRDYRKEIDARIESNRIESLGRAYVGARGLKVKRAMMRRRGKL